MAVVSAKIIWQGRDADYSAGGSGQQTVVRYTRVWRVITNSRDDEGDTIRAALPARGTAYAAGGPRAWLRDIKCRNESFSPYVWICTGIYSSEHETKEAPTDEPAKISWRTQNFRRPYAKDREAKAILNSAGDPYDPPWEGDDSRWQCTIRKNVSAVSTVVLSYKDTINDAEFTVQGVAFPAKTAKIMSIDIGELQRAGDVASPADYYVFTWSFAVNEDTWDPEILDAGKRRKTADDKRERIYGKDGQPVHTPVPLDGAGGVLADPKPDNAVFRQEKPYKLADFSLLPTS